MDPSENAAGAPTAVAINELIDRYRHRCLWFLRPDYYPTTREEQLQALRYIERYGDLEAFQRVGVLKRWLSPSCNEPSAG